MAYHDFSINIRNLEERPLNIKNVNDLTPIQLARIEAIKVYPNFAFVDIEKVARFIITGDVKIRV